MARFQVMAKTCHLWPFLVDVSNLEVTWKILDTPGHAMRTCSNAWEFLEKTLPGLRKLRSLSLDGNMVDFEQWCLALQAGNFHGSPFQSGATVV